MAITRNFTSGAPPQADRVTSATPTILVTNAVAAGDLITILIVFEDAAITVTTITDTSLNSYAQAGGYQRDGASPSTSAIFFCLSAAAASGSTNTVTIHLSGSTLVCAAVQSVTSPGVTWTLDQNTGATGTTGNPASGSVTTTSANEYVVACAYGDSASCQASGSLTPQYTHAPLGGLSFESSGDAILTSTTSINGTFTQGVSGQSSAKIATFAAAGTTLLPSLPIDDRPPPVWQATSYAKRLSVMDPADMWLARIINTRRLYPSPAGLGAFLLFGGNLGPLTSAAGVLLDEMPRRPWQHTPTPEDAWPTTRIASTALPSAGWYDAPTAPSSARGSRATDDLPLGAAARSFGALSDDARYPYVYPRRLDDAGPPPTPSYRPLGLVGSLSPDEPRGVPWKPFKAPEDAHVFHPSYFPLGTIGGVLEDRPVASKVIARRAGDEPSLGQAPRSIAALFEEPSRPARPARALVDDGIVLKSTAATVVSTPIGWATGEGPRVWIGAVRLDDAPPVHPTYFPLFSLGGALEDRPTSVKPGARVSFDEIVLGRGARSVAALGEEFVRAPRSPRALVDDNAPPHPTYQPLFPIGGLGPDETRSVPWPRWRLPEDTHTLHPSYFPLFTSAPVLEGSPPPRWAPLRRIADDAFLGSVRRSPGAIFEAPIPTPYRVTPARLDDALVLKVTAAPTVAGIGGVGVDVLPPWRFRAQVNDDRPMSPPVSPPALTKMGWAVDDPRALRTSPARLDDVHPLKTTTTVTVTSIGWAQDDSSRVRAVSPRAEDGPPFRPTSIVLYPLGGLAPDDPRRAAGMIRTDDAGWVLGQAPRSVGWSEDAGRPAPWRAPRLDDVSSVLAQVAPRSTGWIEDASRPSPWRGARPDDGGFTFNRVATRSNGWLEEPARAAPWRVVLRLDDAVLGQGQPNRSAGWLDDSRPVTWRGRWGQDDTAAPHPAYIRLSSIGGVLESPPRSAYAGPRRPVDELVLSSSPVRSIGALGDEPRPRAASWALRSDEGWILKAAKFLIGSIGAVGDDVRPAWRARPRVDDERPVNALTTALPKMGWAGDDTPPARVLPKRIDDAPPLSRRATITSIGWAAPEPPPTWTRRRSVDDGGVVLNLRVRPSYGWLVDEAVRKAYARVAAVDDAPPLRSTTNFRSIGWAAEGLNPPAPRRAPQVGIDVGVLGNRVPPPAPAKAGYLDSPPPRMWRRQYVPTFDDPVLDSLIPLEIRIVATLLVTYPIVAALEVTDVVLAVGTLTEPIVAVSEVTDPLVAVLTKTDPERGNA